MNPICEYLVITCQSSIKFWCRKAMVHPVKDFIFNHTHCCMFVLLLMGDCMFICVLPFTHPSPSAYSSCPDTSRTTAILPSPAMLLCVNTICDSHFWPNKLFPYHRQQKIQSLEESLIPTYLSKLGHVSSIQTARNSCYENLLAGISYAPWAKSKLDSLKCRSKIISR